MLLNVSSAKKVVECRRLSLYLISLYTRKNRRNRNMRIIYIFSGFCVMFNFLLNLSIKRTTLISSYQRISSWANEVNNECPPTSPVALLNLGLPKKVHHAINRYIHIFSRSNMLVCSFVKAYHPWNDFIACTRCSK